MSVKLYLSIDRYEAVRETAQRLMDLAEAHIRDAGYRGFSFRDLAAEIGIKSASVHHHFPTKAILAAAVARRYGDRFLAAVAPRPNETGKDAVSAYRSAFRKGLEQDGRMCLCGMLGTEVDTPPVSTTTAAALPSATPAQSKTPNPPATGGDAQIVSGLTSRRNWARGLRAPLKWFLLAMWARAWRISSSPTPNFLA